MHVRSFDFDDGLLLFKVPVLEKKPTPEAPKPTATPQKGIVSASILSVSLSLFSSSVCTM